MAAPDFPRRPLADKFLYRGLVRVNAYKCAKFQVPSSISYRDMEGIPEYKVGAADLPRRLRHADLICLPLGGILSLICSRCTRSVVTA